ncbi:hypothetical protein EMPG_12147, partial [Blastomyces silverae]
VSETELFLKFSLNDCIELYIIILIDKRSSIITVTERIEREKNLLTVDTISTDTLTIDILTVDTVIVSVEDVIREAELLRLTNITKFNLIFLTVTEAAVTS